MALQIKESGPFSQRVTNVSSEIDELQTLLELVDKVRNKLETQTKEGEGSRARSRKGTATNPDCR